MLSTTCQAKPEPPASCRGPTKRDMTKKTEGEKKQNKEESQHKTEKKAEAKADQGSVIIATK